VEKGLGGLYGVMLVLLHAVLLSVGMGRHGGFVIISVNVVFQPLPFRPCIHGMSRAEA
jgi:hypothetical protein